MRGEVLHYDDDSGTGFISGAGGARYAFERGDLRRLVPIAKGTLVEFQPDGERAREIFTVRGEASSPAAGGSQHFGRLAETAQPESTGLWSYFWRSVTTNYVTISAVGRVARNIGVLSCLR